ncbi:MAG: hypothetical protein GF418_15770 [Chitinivibrionales bacterium]|nr:hypothetical protein [Chitinivibrionales bacterium]MBD3397080.1 hypothetical protein [Chitinivibrionales bacterium]
MHRRVLLLAGIFTVLTVCVCQKVEKEDRFVKIGWRTMSREDFDAFMKMQRQYPSALSSVFPGDRSPATFMVELEILYRRARWGSGRLKKTADWQWKKHYFPAQLYIQQVIAENAGFTDEQIEKYYHAHIDSYEVVKQVPVMRDSVAGDSVIQVETDSTRDSTYHRPLAEVRNQIAEKLFTSTYPPDSAFWVDAVAPGDSSVDTSLVLSRWYRRWRRDLPNFFMRKEYERQTGEPFPDSLEAWYGEGKLITPADMDAILSWLSEDRRESYTNESGKRYLAEWLLKWKLFSARAREIGFDKKKDVREVLDWAWKLQVVNNFVENKLVPRAEKGITIDTAMCLYAYWDKRGTPGVTPDSAAVAETVEEYHTQKVGIVLDRIIAKMRSKTGVKFLQSDWKDEKDRDPAVMMAEADSLLAANESRKAESTYRDVYKYFPYTEHGMKALTEMAKIQTEKGKYRDAIRNYRTHVILSEEAGRQCNTFFMIGFIYDEYLSKPEHAEVHYKWILKNTPECELADDAEFMFLHLDEPMTSVEELQAEARRQGRNIDDTEPVEEVVEEKDEGEMDE